MAKFSMEGDTYSSLCERTLRASAHSPLVVAVETAEGWLILNRTPDSRQRIFDIRGEYREKLLYVAESNISKKFAQITLGEDTNRSDFLKQNIWAFLVDSLSAKIALNSRGNTKGLEKFSSGIDRIKLPRNTSYFMIPSHSQVMLFEADYYNRTNNKIIHKWTMGDDHIPHRHFAIMGSLYICKHSPIFDNFSKDDYLKLYNEYEENSYPQETTKLAENIANILSNKEPEFFGEPSETILTELRPHLALDNLDTEIFLETVVLDSRMGFRRFDGHGNEVEVAEREQFWRWTEVRPS